MTLSKEQKEELEGYMKTIMRFLCDNCHPHAVIIIESTSAELLSGEIAIVSDEFLRD